MNRMKGIDAMKVFMAFMAVCCHTIDHSLLNIREVIVPFFFIISGFFLFGKMTEDRRADLAYIRRWTLKALRIYLIWTAIYLPFTIYGFIQDELTLKQSVVLFIRNLFFVGENFLSWPLWYLLSLCWTGLLFYCLRAARASLWVYILLGAIIFIVPFVPCIRENDLFIKVFKGPSFPVFRGPFFMALGGLIRRYNIRVPLWGGFLLTVVGMVILQFTYLAGPLAAAGLFLFSRELSLPFVSDRLSLAFRDISETIYLAHMIFAGTLLLAGMQKGIPLFVISSVLVTLAAIGRYKLKTR